MILVKVPADFKAQLSIITFSLHQRESRSLKDLRPSALDTERTSASGRILLTRPLKTLPGPISTNRRHPLRPISRIDSSQRTADVSWRRDEDRISSGSVKDAASALLMRGGRSRARGRAADEGSEGFRRGPHEGAVRRHADGERDELSHAAGLELLDGPVHGGARAGDDDLAGGVEVGGPQDLAAGGRDAGGFDRLRVRPEDGHHFSVSGRDGVLHGLTARPDDPKSVRQGRPPAAKIAVYSAQGMAGQGNGRRGRSPMAAQAAALTARIAGWVLAVLLRSSSGPSKQSRESSNPRTRSASSKTDRAAAFEGTGRGPSRRAVTPGRGR